jgi:hypothetical protein
VVLPKFLPYDPLQIQGTSPAFKRPARLQTEASSGLAGEDKQEGSQNGELFSAFMQTPSMAGLGGSLSGGGSATLERSGLDLTQKEEVSQAKTDDTGGGGNNGKDIHNGGGGDGDDGDDDDYFGDEDDGDGDENMFTKRTAIPELFDRASIEAVLQEWYKTLYSLPAAVRMAVEMGLISTAQLVNFVSLDARPTLVRAVARATPQAFSREFVGRMMGDPSFLGKLMFEQATTAAIGITYEVQQRGERFSKELDLAFVNVAGMMATNLAFSWCLTPNRSVGNMHKYAWQRTLHGLPNNAFDRSGPQRNFTYATRAAGVAVKAAQLSTVGLAVGAATGAASNALAGLRTRNDQAVSMTVPSVSTSACGNGAFAGLSGNVRYQLINGLDRYLGMTYNSLPLVLSASALARIMNQIVAEPNRRHWLGLPMEAPKRLRYRKVVKKQVVAKKTTVKKAKPEMESFSVSATA